MTLANRKIPPSPNPRDREIPRGVGRSNGPGGGTLDRWFRYPAGFSATSLELCFEKVGAKEGDTILDPFAGVATSGVAARSRGMRYVGIETHPLVVEVASLKLTPPPSGALEGTFERLTKKLKPAAVYSVPDLVRKTFDDETLGTMIALRRRIERLENPEHLYAKWSLLATLRDVATSGVGWPYQLPDRSREPRYKNVITRFAQRLTMIREDLKLIPSSPRFLIRHADSRYASAWRDLGKWELAGCVTSPPYLNNFDYADATRLEAAFWNGFESWGSHQAEMRPRLLTATTHHAHKARALRDMKVLERVAPEVATDLKGLAERLEEERKARPRGKEYDILLPSYFRDLHRVLAHMGTVLRKGAVAAWVVGDSAPYAVFVDTPDLIARLAEACGFERESLVTLRRRGLRWAVNGTRHQLPLSEKLIVLTKQ